MVSGPTPEVLSEARAAYLAGRIQPAAAVKTPRNFPTRSVVAIVIVVVLLAVGLPLALIGNSSTPGRTTTSKHTTAKLALVDTGAAPQGWTVHDFMGIQYAEPATGSTSVVASNPTQPKLRWTTATVHGIKVKRGPTGEVVVATNVGLTVSGPDARQVLGTLTNSPLGVLESNQKAPIPPSWKTEHFAGIHFKVPGRWRVVREPSAPCVTPLLPDVYVLAAKRNTKMCPPLTYSPEAPIDGVVIIAGPPSNSGVSVPTGTTRPQAVVGVKGKATIYIGLKGTCLTALRIKDSIKVGS